MTDLDFTTADWDLIRRLQELCNDLFDPENLTHNNWQVNTVLSAGWTLFELKLAPIQTFKEIDIKQLFNEFEEWFLGAKYTELYDFENYLKEVTK